MSVLLDSLDSGASWDRYFSADSVGQSPINRYTPALTAELTASPFDSANAGSAAVCKSHSAPCLRLANSASSGLLQLSSSSSSSSLASSPDDSSDSECEGPHLRKVNSCLAGVRSCASAGKKRVQFADELGQQLARVRVLSEPSHLPPRLPRTVIRRCRRASSSSSISDSSSSNGAAEHSLPSTTTPSLSPLFTPASLPASPADCELHCRFQQPSSRFVLFRERLASNGVCLSSVDCSTTSRPIIGRVSVKNVCYRKRVFARVTMDGWRSHTDVEAKFVESDGQFDSFEFQFTCPSDQTSTIELCVCFVSESGQESWDSNGGSNYTIGVAPSTQIPSFTSDYKPSFAGVAEFAQFTAWGHFADSVYY